MTRSPAQTVTQYLAALPADRRKELQAVRRVILDNLDSDYEEGIQYGMIGYYVPHSVYPPGYHSNPKLPLTFASLGAQKNHLALHLVAVYVDGPLAKWFRSAWARTGKKLDMGKACVRFKVADELALDVIGELVERVPARLYAASVERALAKRGKGQRAKAKPKAKARRSAQ